MRGSVVDALVSIDSGQLILFVAGLLGTISTLAGLVHAGDLARIKDRDAIIANRDATIVEQKAMIARFQSEAEKAIMAKDAEISEWRRVARTNLERTSP